MKSKTPLLRIVLMSDDTDPTESNDRPMPATQTTSRHMTCSLPYAIKPLLINNLIIIFTQSL